MFGPLFLSLPTLSPSSPFPHIVWSVNVLAASAGSCLVTSWCKNKHGVGGRCLRLRWHCHSEPEGCSRQRPARCSRCSHLADPRQPPLLHTLPWPASSCYWKVGISETLCGSSWAECRMLCSIMAQYTLLNTLPVTFTTTGALITSIIHENSLFLTFA